MSSGHKKITISEMVATARIYALISVVCAHLPFSDSVVGVVFDKIGTVGVVVFLISSGYYFLPEKFKSFSDLLKKKGKSICIPWVVLGSLVWVYNTLLSAKFRSPLGYVKWIFGNGTYLYYVPILMICFLVCYKASKKLLIGFLVLNVLSVGFTSVGILSPIINSLHITNYLNPFNWIGFFALGMLLRNVSEKKLCAILMKYRLLFCIGFVIAMVLAVIFKNVNLTYFSYAGIPFELLGSMALLSLSTLPLVRINLFKNLSACSYAIYLIHMIFIGLLDSVLGKMMILQILSPVFIVFITFLLLMFGDIISSKLRINEVYYLLTGLRIKNNVKLRG